MYLTVGIGVAIAYVLCFGDDYLELMEFEEFWSDLNRMQRLNVLFIAVILTWPRFLEDFVEL